MFIDNNKKIGNFSLSYLTGISSLAYRKFCVGIISIKFDQ